MDLHARRLAKSAIGAMLYFSECSRANCRLILWWTARSGRARWNGLIASPCGTLHGQRISTIRFQQAMDESNFANDWGVAAVIAKQVRPLTFVLTQYSANGKQSAVV